MLAYIEGKLSHKSEGSIIVETNGIGFEICVSNNTLASLPLQNEDCKIFTYLHVKEDEMSLYGFADYEEKQLFMKLISVSGIGPKGAIALLSGMKLTDLLVAISNEDVAALTKIKGLGKKTAERVCLELKDKIGFVGGCVGEEIQLDQNIVQQAVETLLSLGMNKHEANALAVSCYEDNDTVESLVTKMFVSMGR